MKHFMKFQTKNGMDVWVRKSNVTYIHDDNSEKQTCCVLHFNGHDAPLKVKGNSLGIKDKLECA